jgi:hypothetical protein
VIDKFDEVLHRLLAVRALDVGLEQSIVPFDRPDSSQALHTEDDFIFELPLLVLVVVVHHQLKILVLAQVALVMFKVIDFIHWR